MRTPLHYAAQFGNLDIAKTITNHITDRNPKDIHGYTPLHSAASNGHLEIVTFLKKFVSNVNIRAKPSHKGKTPLHVAAQHGHFPVVKYLIAEGADTMMRSYENKTAYDYAIENQHFSLSNYL